MKTHAIIGGSTGIGGATARTLHLRGDRVWLADEPGAQRIAEQIGVHFMAMELGDPAAPAVLCEQIAAGEGRLDSLVVAASLMNIAPLPQWQAADWDLSCAVNLRLPFLAAQAAQSLLTRSRGSIVLVSSTASLRGQAGSHAYQASKAGLAGLLRSLAAELGPSGIRVNLVLAGWLNTPSTDAYWATHPDADTARASINARIPLRRHGYAQEVADTIAWLTSEAASYVTGAMIPLDGGETAV